MHLRSILKILVLPILLLNAQAQDLAENSYKVGQSVKEFSAADKNGNNYTFTKGTRFILVSFDMSTGKKANKALAQKGANYLPQNKAVFIAHIHGMPEIGRFFALPKMKRYPHPIILADAKDLLTPFPQHQGSVTVLKLDSQAKIIAISFWDPSVQKIEDQLK